MKDVIKRKTAINAKDFAGVYGCTDFVGAGHTSRIAAEKRKEKRRATQSARYASMFPQEASRRVNMTFPSCLQMQQSP